ncbi:GHMP family kinase ATP-binding protein [Candidatus Sarmatiella mevalonica]|uniref:GHMP family kinase ATP-binding protein n=1 Tax=Candidatus Sarmatiella mevalonica TaxID=2770581 RepID=UPI0019206E3E|nr:hypothetical protein [Candidatus Sarmatiella mevalonica]
MVGEHIVVRGEMGIVMPIKFWRTTLVHHPYAGRLRIITQHACEQVCDDLAGFEQFCIQLFPHLTGIAYITSNIPLRAGLGSSAALCVCIARLIRRLGSSESCSGASEFDVFQNAKLLEGYFHGTSSGIDVVGATAASAKLYASHPLKIRGIGDALDNRFIRHLSKLAHDEQMQGSYEVQNVQRTKIREDFESVATCASRSVVEFEKRSIDRYRLAISFAGYKEPTSSVRGRMQNYSEGARLMHKAVLDARYFYGMDHDFSSKLAHKGCGRRRIKYLIRAMNKGRDAFNAWQLVDDRMVRHMHWLDEMGALACKPTGAGLGGYCISLWPSSRPLA